MKRAEVDAVLQEAIMTPWWADVVERQGAHVLPAEQHALNQLRERYGIEAKPLAADHWPGLVDEIPAVDFSDFLFVVRSDMPSDLAHLLTWALVETREKAERQYRHLPVNRSPLTYPLVPAKMATTAIPLHPGATDYYTRAGILPEVQHR
jgi:TRAP-type uncharacterized transport system substrate-binding protein